VAVKCPKKQTKETGARTPHGYFSNGNSRIMLVALCLLYDFERHHH
jgi:hypothetical protein